MNLRRWKMRIRAFFAPRRVERELNEELAFHLARETHEHLARGVSLDEARTRAAARFGSVPHAADACRDARGTALVEHAMRDVVYACRAARRAPLPALTIVMTIGLGLGLIAAVFTFLNVFIFRVDAVRNPYELFAVERQRSENVKPEGFTRADYEALTRETDLFAGAYARTAEIDSWIDGRRMEGPLVSGNFFQVLGVSATLGRTLVPEDDAPGGRPVIVLSHRAWVQQFASDPGVLHTPILLNGARFHVVGVMPDGFRGLTVSTPDYWAPLALRREFRQTPPEPGRDDVADLGIVGRLKPGLSRAQAVARLMAWDARRLRERAGARTDAQAGALAALSLTLEPRLGTVPQPMEALLLFTPLFVAFGLILMIGCANVANLLLARGVARQREIGIRLAMGASRRRVIAQLLTENLVLALVSAALAFGISRLVLVTGVHALTRTFPPDFGNIGLSAPAADWRVVLFLVGAAIAATLLFALAPTLQATRIELVRAMRGEVVRDGRPSRARDALVALQVTGSVLLLICAAVFLRSSWAAARVDPGIRTSDTVIVRVLNEQRRAAILEVVRREPTVATLAATAPGAVGGRRAVAEGPSGKSSVTYQHVSPEYFDVLDVNVVRGRRFTENERSTRAAVAIVSDTVARQLWPGADAVGQVLRLTPDTTVQGDDEEAGGDAPPLLSQSFIIVGIARDVAGFRLGGARAAGAGVYVPSDAGTAGTALTLRVRGDAERTRHALVDRLASVDPNMSEVSTLRTIARMESYLLAIPFWLTLGLGALALLLTLSGLFSVLSYLVEQRIREIGVRMALGATSGSIAMRTLAQSARPVGVGLLLGSVLTAALSAALLATPVAEGIGSSVRLFDPIAYLVSLFCIVAACAGAALLPALRAGRIDPVAALRQD